MADKITKDQLIALLNEDLAREYQAVITYRTYASAVPGPRSNFGAGVVSLDSSRLTTDLQRARDVRT